MTETAAGPSSPATRSNPADAEVVARVLEGHRDEYRILIQRYQERFHRFAFGMVDDPDAAIDLVQDSFVKAYTNLDACRNPSQFQSWAYQILRNRCRDYLKNIRRAHQSLEDSPTLVSPLGRPAADLQRSELRRDLRRALATLPGAHREAFLLKHLDGYTYQEISEELGASLSAVKMRVHRSREMLQEHLEKNVTNFRPRSSSEVKAEASSESKSK